MDPLLFGEDWYGKAFTVISLTLPEILELMAGRTRPTTGSNGGGTAAALARTQAAYDKANQDLHAILSMVTEAPASFLVSKHKETTGIRGNEQETLL